MGIGFAAIRDIVSFLRYETKDAAGEDTHQPGAGFWHLAERPPTS